MEKYTSESAVQPWKHDRRSFLKLSGLLGTGLMLGGPSLAWGQGSSVGAAMTQAASSLSALVLTDKAASLALGSKFVGAGLKHCLNRDLRRVRPGNAYYVGSVMPHDTDALVAALEKEIDQWRAGQQGLTESQRLAVLSGALVHRALLPQLDKALPGSLSPEKQAEARIYQAADLLRTYFFRGMPMGPEAAQELLALFMELQPRAFTRFHTMMPDEADGPGWVLKIAEWRAATHDYYGQLAQAIAHPNGGKVARYVADTSFVAGNDPILKRASTFERLAFVDREKADALTAQGANQSHAGQALARAYRALIAISDYQGGRADLDAVRQAVG